MSTRPSPSLSRWRAIRIAALLWLWPWSATAAGAQAEAAPVVTCRACANTGRVLCGKHGRSTELETSANTRFCSVVIDCKVCGGALASDCKKCDNAPVEAELLERRRLAQDWLAQRRAKVEKAENHESFLFLATPHFELTFSIRPTTVGRKKLDTHTLMHLYGDRLEALRARFMQVLELTDVDVPDPMRVYMFEKVEDHGVIGPQETGFGAARSSGLKLMGPEFVYSMWQDLRTMPDDENLHRNIVHCVTHLLLSQMRQMLFLGNKKHGWIDEGLSHWFEEDLTGKCTNFCFEEVLLQAGAGFKGGRWRTPVRKLVDEGKVISFAELSSLNTDQLTFVQHAFAFAYCDFLITGHGGAKFRDLVRLLKNGMETRDALKQVYGWNPLTIDAPFAAWVQENYSPRELR